VKQLTLAVKQLTLALGLCTLTAIPAGATSLGETWQADFDVAAKLAKEQGKDLLVDFTGSDWCGWCIKLHEEVFDHDAFLVAAREQYILVALDFPRSDEAKAKVPNPERNDELKNKYKIGGFPSVLLMTAEGEVFGKTGYRDGGPEKYIENMAKLRSEGRPVLEKTKRIVGAFQAAAEPEKLAAWQAVMDLLESLPDNSALAAPLIEPARWGFNADPKNEKGLKLRALKALLSRGEADEELLSAGRELDPKNEGGLLEKVVQAEFSAVRSDEAAQAARVSLDLLTPFGFRDTELGFQLNFTMCRWCAGPLDDAEGVQSYGAAAKACGTKEKEMLDFLEQVMNG
jgi:thioredoxin-related protein